jgi:hypothetical protein
MDKPSLTDKAVFPDHTVLADTLGKAIDAWDAFNILLAAEHPFYAVEWKYYNDGKRWLCKVHKKTKTMCWISVWDNFFRIGFYFGNKEEDAIQQSTLDDSLKKQYADYNGKLKIRPLVIVVKKKSDLKPLQELFMLKEQIK